MCGIPLEGRSICHQCGWDGVLEHRTRPGRLRPLAWIARLVLSALPVVLLLGGLQRYARTGPGPDLLTTLRWIVSGDDGRAAELATLGRMYEIARAVSRYTLLRLEPPSFEGDWQYQLVPYETAAVRGWYPLLFVMADAKSAPASVRELFAIEPVDGWERPWRIAVLTLGRDEDRSGVPEVTEDLTGGLQSSLFRRGAPDLATGSWLRLRIGSSGPDGRWNTEDDIALIAWIRAERTFRAGTTLQGLEGELKRDFLQGPVFFRITGSRWDLVDTRILGEFRLDLLR